MMKKFIALTIGLSLLGAALIVPMSDASREAYHSYIMQKIKESGRYRHSTFRRGDLKRVIFSRETAKPRGAQKKRVRNYLLPRIGKRNLFRSNKSNRNLPLRPSTHRIGRIKSNLQSSHRLRIPSRPQLRERADYMNYSNDFYTLEIPRKSIINDENDVLELSFPLSSAKFQAKKLGNTCNENLKVCAQGISRGLDRQKDIYRVSKTVQQYQNSDVTLGNVDLDEKKFVEGFIGFKEGQNKFFARFIAQNEAGEVFLLEVSSDLENIDEAIVIAKKIFESFRAK